ncbi:MAG: hypothetical protein ACYC4A_02595 [Desulfobulbia bacterium]
MMLPSKNMINLVIRFRALCLERYADDIDVLSREERDARMGITQAQDDLGCLLGLAIKKEPIADICSLAKTPRLLKLVLRRAYRIWGRLHGEIDFDDLLVATTLRFGAPEAFEFLLEYYGELRAISREREFQARSLRRTPLDAKFEFIAKGKIWDMYSARTLGQFLFPSWTEAGSSSEQEITRRQGIQVAAPTDYWLRYLAEELEPNAIRDQEVLHGLVAWRASASKAHFRGATLPLALCTEEEFSHKFEHLCPAILDGYDIRQMAKTTFEQALNLQGINTGKDSIVGFIPLWRLAIRQPIDEAEHIEWVKNEIFKALPRNFRFANDIYYYWKHNREHEINGSPNRTVTELRSQVVSHVREIFEDNPNILIEAINPSEMYISSQFCIFFSSHKEGGEGFNAGDWRWFSDLLLKAGEISPQVILPQIVGILTNEEHSGRGDFSYMFKDELSRELFGEENISRLMNMLSQKISDDSFDVRERKRIETAQEFASEWHKKTVLNR